MSDIGLPAAPRITAAIFGFLALLALAIQWGLSHKAGQISHAQEMLAARACRQRNAALLMSSRRGPVVYAFCGDPKTRVVSARLEIVVW